MPYPDGLHVIERPASESSAPTVVLVHGSLDRGGSFRRVMRRMPDVTTVAYDRRGYGGSRAAGVVGLSGHISDLIDVVAHLRSRRPVSLSVVGHSLGGDVVVGAALADPAAFDAIGAFEPPMPWLGFRRAPADGGRARGWAPVSEDPGVEAELFFGRMVGPNAWQRLSDEARSTRRADGPALVADLTSVRGQQPFDVLALAVPAVFGMGGEGSQEHHRTTVAWLGSHVPGAESFAIAGAQHGAHLSHPDHFSLYVRRVIARVRPEAR